MDLIRCQSTISASRKGSNRPDSNGGSTDGCGEQEKRMDKAAGEERGAVFPRSRGQRAL